MHMCTSSHMRMTATSSQELSQKACVQHSHWRLYLWGVSALSSLGYSHHPVQNSSRDS